jgi:hypothetical protein
VHDERTDSQGVSSLRARGRVPAVGKLDSINIEVHELATQASSEFGALLVVGGGTGVNLDLNFRERPHRAPCHWLRQRGLYLPPNRSSNWSSQPGTDSRPTDCPSSSRYGLRCRLACAPHASALPQNGLATCPGFGDLLDDLCRCRVLYRHVDVRAVRLHDATWPAAGFELPRQCIVSMALSRPGPCFLGHSPASPRSFLAASWSVLSGSAVAGAPAVGQGSCISARPLSPIVRRAVGACH